MASLIATEIPAEAGIQFLTDFHDNQIPIPAPDPIRSLPASGGAKGDQGSPE
jgi:hypothetical protein